MLGVSRRVVLRSAHDAGLPVRVGGAPPQRGPSEIELIQALYADTMVSAVLTRHGVPEVPEAGPIWQRFPVPHKLTAELAAELYWDCGLGLHHIELLTGQPAGTVSNLLRARGVPLRSAGGRSPFMRRWREGNGLRIVRDCPRPHPGRWGGGRNRSLALTEVTGQLDALRINNGAPDQTVERVGRTMHPDLLPSRWAEQKPSTAEAAVREAMVSASGHHLTDTRLLNGAPPGQFPKPVTPPGQYGRLARRPY
jgi:hypothetical protein